MTEIHDKGPAKTIAEAISNSRTLVEEVHASAGNSQTQGAGATIISHGKGNPGK